MPNIKSAKKKVKVAERNRLRNREWKSKIRTQKNKIEEALKSADHAALDQSLSGLYQIIDKAVVKGIVKKNTAARHKSRLAKKVLSGKSAS